MKKKITYIKGDATYPSTNPPAIIVHICNDIGAWGKGFVMAISQKWKEPEIQYRAWHASQDNFLLGEVQFVKVESDIWVANIIGQHKIYHDKNGIPPIRYDAVVKGLDKVADFTQKVNGAVHMPRIGCGLAGGKWEEIEPLIIKTISNKEISVTVYDL